MNKRRLRALAWPDAGCWDVGGDDDDWITTISEARVQVVCCRVLAHTPRDLHVELLHEVGDHISDGRGPFFLQQGTQLELVHAGVGYTSFVNGVPGTATVCLGLLDNLRLDKIEEIQDLFLGPAVASIVADFLPFMLWNCDCAQNTRREPWLPWPEREEREKQKKKIKA